METFLFITLILLALFWFDSITAREAAIAKGHELTARTNLQLLDETVACSRLRLGRNSRGHIQLLRTYDFEVSANGSDRLACNLVLLGSDLQSWYIPPYLQAVE